ncbi:MAG: LacI family DNA-binding transcriptional regulator [Planctomycetota bacterium]|jgi:DNA-binding LacI/PurR family transcriptional regulator|nr:LacI family DNA-binding transcriptional regulator [Planctomycetota bacterium]
MAGSNLHAVAKEAGVSVSTASRVLNKAPGTVAISAATIARVRAAANSLGYVPHAAARMLRTGRSRCIGVLGAHPSFFAARGHFTGEIMAGLMRAGVELGYHTTLLTGWEHFVAGGDIHADLGSADGLLVLNRDLYQNPAHMDTIRRCRIPVVYALEHPDGDPDVVYARPDDEQGGRLAVEALRHAGHERIGFGRNREWQGIFGRRQRGWETAMRAAGVELRDDWVFNETPDPQCVAELGLTAIIGANQSIGRTAHQVLADAGVPVELVVFGHLDERGAPLQDDPAVAHDLAGCIARAVHQLVGLIEGKTIDRQILAPMAFHPSTTALAGPTR